MINLCSRTSINNIYKTISFGKKHSNFKHKDMDIFIMSQCNNLSNFQLEGTPTDIEYRKKICSDIGIRGIKPYKLASVIGPDEFKDTIVNNSSNRTYYTTGERPNDKLNIPDTNKLENVKMKLFGGDFHVHTKHSDGKLSVEDVLNQAAEYGNEYAKENEGRPFIIGITDHNTVEGCKQAVKIIAANPYKYRNIKVVLGVEISTKEDELNGYKFTKPEKYHILAMCINPFDPKLNAFLDDLKSISGSPLNIKNISIKDVFDGVRHQEQCFFALAHPAYPDITHRIGKDKDPYEMTKKAMKHFKDITKDRGLYSEAYYSSYSGNWSTNPELYKTIIHACDELGLYKAGGIDVHGESIFYSGQRFSQK